MYKVRLSVDYAKIIISNHDAVIFAKKTFILWSDCKFVPNFAYFTISKEGLEHFL